MCSIFSMSDARALVLVLLSQRMPHAIPVKYVYLSSRQCISRHVTWDCMMTYNVSYMHHCAWSNTHSEAIGCNRLGQAWTGLSAVVSSGIWWHSLMYAGPAMARMLIASCITTLAQHIPNAVIMSGHVSESERASVNSFAENRDQNSL